MAYMAKPCVFPHALFAARREDNIKHQVEGRQRTKPRKTPSVTGEKLGISPQHQQDIGAENRASVFSS